MLNTSRRTKMAWSPVAIPVHRDLKFIIADTRCSTGLLPSMATSNLPHVCPTRAAAWIRMSARNGSTVSACKKRSQLPRAKLAPVFICLALPRGADTTRWACTEAKYSVPSELSPSTTMTSMLSLSSNAGCRRNAEMPGASFRVGTITLSQGRATLPSGDSGTDLHERSCDTQTLWASDIASSGVSSAPVNAVRIEASGTTGAPDNSASSNRRALARLWP
jgi:hypothetical protein